MREGWKREVKERFNSVRKERKGKRGGMKSEVYKSDGRKEDKRKVTV